MIAKIRSVLIVMFGLALSATSTVRAQNLVGRPSSGLFGLKAGVLSRMNLEGEYHLHSELASTAELFADFPRGRDFYMSVAFDFHYIEISRSNQVMIEPNVGLKKSFYLPHLNMVLRPGGAIGFAYLADSGDLKASQYLTFKIFVEAHFKIDARKAWLMELALFHAPRGSNGDFDLSLGPGLMLRLGLAFR